MSAQRMTPSRIEQAVRNNALWCDTLCRAHGAPGEFYDTIWLNRSPVPRFYPNAITLADQRDAAAQRIQIQDLLSLNLPNGWGVKDSFCTLDLFGLGFHLQFEGSWLWHAPTRITSDTSNDAARWAIVRSAPELAQWETAWSGVDAANPSSRLQPRFFMPALLADPDIAFIAAYQGDGIVAGGIANGTGDVVGLSNVFVPVADSAAFLAGCIVTIQDRFLGLPLVGYQRGTELAMAESAGFEKLQDLRVWTRSM